MATMNNGRSATYRDTRLQKRCSECGAGIELCSCENPDDAAHRRLWSREGKLMCEVWRGLQQAIDAGFGSEVQREWLAVDLQLKAADTLKKLRGHTKIDGTTAEEIHRACVVVAVGALLLSLYGDPAYSYEPEAVHDREDA